jgi:hypothetical protein
MERLRINRSLAVCDANSLNHRRAVICFAVVCIPVMLTPSSSDCDPSMLEIPPHPFQWL